VYAASRWDSLRAKGRDLRTAAWAEAVMAFARRIREISWGDLYTRHVSRAGLRAVVL